MMRVGSSRWVPDPNISGGEGLPGEVMCKQGPKGWGIIHGKGKERGGGRRVFETEEPACAKAEQNKRSVWNTEFRMGEWQERRRKKSQG